MGTAGEYRSKIGLDELNIALVTQDDVDAYAAETPEWLAPAAMATQEPVSNFQIQYADNQPYDVHTAEAETKISLEITGLDPATLAKILGRVYDATNHLMYDNGGLPPYCALSFRALKSTKKYRYYQYLKGKFEAPKEEVVTLAEKPDPKQMTMTFTAIRTIHKFALSASVTDTVKRIIGDEDTTGFSGATWFDAVQVPTYSAPSALALSSSVPTDAATGVSVTANQVLTFNNALAGANPAQLVTLIKASDGTVVAGTHTLDATRKIITIDPTGSLTASTDYIITYAMTDVYGQTLNGAINFTTA